MEGTIWEQVLAILKDPAAIGYLATVDNGKPRVRPFGFMFEENGHLYFCTSSTKDVYKQMISVPFIEYSKTTKDFSWVRVSGEIIFDDDIEKKKKILDQIPELVMVFQAADNPEFKVFYLAHGKAILDDFTQPRRSYEF